MPHPNNASLNEHPDQKKPWYKQRWLLFLISVPLASVILSSIMVTVAVKGKDSLVKDNYYKHGMEINQTIFQDRRADDLQLRPIISTSLDGTVRMQFNSTLLEPQAFVTVNINHPTLQSRDVSVKLLPTADGYIADIPKNLTGRHYVDIYAFDESWRIREELVLPIDSHMLNQDKPKNNQVDLNESEREKLDSSLAELNHSQ